MLCASPSPSRTETIDVAARVACGAPGAACCAPLTCGRRPKDGSGFLASRIRCCHIERVTHEKTDRDRDAAVGEDPNDVRERSRPPTSTRSSRVPPGGPAKELSKATIVLHAQSFVINRFGTEGWDAVLDRLPIGDRQTYDGILPIAWYPHEADVRLFHAIDEVLGQGNKKVLVDLARFEAEQDLRGIHRLFLRLANPAYILEKASDYWSRFHNSGHWTVERKGSGAATGTLFGWGAPDETKCVYLGAYIVRMFELVGVRHVRFVHSRCRCRGDRGCTFEGTWGP